MEAFIRRIADEAVDEFADVVQSCYSFMKGRDFATARLRDPEQYGRIGGFRGLLKLHKGQQSDGHWMIRCVVSHRSSIITPIFRANGILWRMMRFELERT